jgi:hypothetical protein
VNAKVVVVGPAGTKDVPLPSDLLEPSDFLATSRGYIVVGALGDVVAIDAEGKLITRTKTTYDPASGSPRLVARSTSTFVLENLRGQRVQVDLGKADIGTLVVPGLATVSGYTQESVSANRVVLKSKAVKGPLASITVTSNIRIASARPVWVAEGDGALIAVQETRRYPEESAFVRLLNLDAEGKPTTETYLRPESFSCDTVRPFARLTDGRVVSLSFHEKKRLKLNFLNFNAAGTATPIAATIGSDTMLIGAEQSELEEIERANGTSDTREISMSSISRSSILKRARKALELRWLLTSSAYSQPDIENRCDPPSNRWARAKRLEGREGTWITAVPYAWGSYLANLNTFLTRLSDNHLAGNVCTCRRANCVNKRATGMDCSGFVSYAWRTGSYFTTASLPNSNVSTPVRWTELTPGDIVNKAGSHVRLVESVSPSPNGTIVTVIESAVSASCGGVCRKSYTQVQLQTGGYRPLRRIALSD